MPSLFAVISVLSRHSNYSESNKTPDVFVLNPLIAPPKFELVPEL